jgi:DNA processing protein
MTRDPRYAWLALGRISGIGRVLYRRLIDRFGTPSGVFQADRRELLGVEGLREQAARNILNFKGEDVVKGEIEALDRLKIHLLTLRDPGYPSLLAEIHDPPPFLYYQGCPSEQDRRVIALVGSRNGSPYGIKATERLAYSLAQQGLTIASGLARGIDTAAHEGALLAKGRTVAVLGSGLDLIYPPENRKLAERITANGMICSEFPPGTLPERQNFPVRNRIISGMSLGVVIVEAGLRSGSLITARLALEQGREVFAVPGSIESFKSSGTHRLIKQGAKLVEQVQDILEEIPGASSHRPTVPIEKDVSKPWPPFTPEQEGIWKALAGGPVQVDPLARQTGLGMGILLSELLEMEIKGWVRQLPGKFFERR